MSVGVQNPNDISYKAEKLSSKKISIKIYFLLFTISGFTGLIYESIWTHYLKLFLGHAAYAQSLVLVIFMGGMAVGAWLISKRSAKIKNLLITYAVVEAIIGFFALFFHPFFNHVTKFIYSSILPGTESIFTGNMIKWGISALLILPQTILLGSTFPLMSGGVIRKYTKRPGKSLAFLYFTNSLGGAIGVLASGFWLVKTFGLPGTIFIAGILNIVLAGLVYFISKKDSLPALFDQKINNPVKENQFKVSVFLLVALLSGMASFMYEIGWLRMLSLVLGNSNHAFELMLSAFILGLALGGLFIRKRIDKLPDVVKTLAVVQLFMGFFALLTLITYNQTFHLMSSGMKNLPMNDQGYLLFNLLSHGLAMIIMLPATICAGMILPLLTYHLLQLNYGERAIGRIYGANTIGSILGIIIAVHLIMPWLGVKNVVVIGGSIDILLGIILLKMALKTSEIKTWYSISSLAAIVIVIFCFIRLDKEKMSSGVFYAGLIPKDQEVLYHKDGKTSTINLLKYSYVDNRNVEREGLGITTNGNWVGNLSTDSSSILGEENQILQAAIPMALNENAKKAATFGMGTGLTAHVLLSNPEMESVDIIEIEPAVIEGANLYGQRVLNIYNDPRCRIFIEDAKAFFSSRNEKYDIVISDPPYAWVSGVAGLFSKEFYHFIYQHLNPGGLFVQWVYIYSIDMPLVSSIMKAFSESFDDYTIYYTNENYLAIIGSNQKIREEPGSHVFSFPSLKYELQRIDVLNEHDLLLHKIGSKEILDPLFKSYPIHANSDFYPVLDQQSVKARFLSKNARELIDLKASTIPILSVLSNKTHDSTSAYTNKNINYIQKSATQGVAIYQFYKSILKAEEFYQPDIRLDPMTQEIVRNIRLINLKTDLSEQEEKDWLLSLTQLMKLTLPYLSVHEMTLIFNSIEKAPGFLNLTSATRKMYMLYKYLSNREFEKINKIKLFSARGGIKSSVMNSHLMEIALLTKIKLGDYQEGIDLWNRYQNDNEDNLRLKILTTYLESKI